MTKGDIIGFIVMTVLVVAFVVFLCVTLVDARDGKVRCAATNGTTEVIYQEGKCYVKK